MSDAPCPVTAELDRIAAEASAIGVTVEAYYDDFHPDIHVAGLDRDVSDPSTKGNGGRVISSICALADRIGATVSIEHMTDETRLGAYYASFGFVPEANPAFITNMTRPASTLQEAA